VQLAEADTEKSGLRSLIDSLTAQLETANDATIPGSARVSDCDTKLVEGGRQEKPFEMT
jgi:hypothetical protein